MHEEILFLLKLLAGISGVLFVYAGVFLYRDEEQLLQNRLEDYWLNLSFKKDKYDGVILSAVNISVQAFTRWFDELFGSKLLSRQSVITSTLLSVLFSPIIVLFGIIIYKLYSNTTDYAHVSVWFVWGSVIIVCFLWFRYMISSVTCKSFINSYQKSTINYIGNLFVLFFFQFLLMGTLMIIYGSEASRSLHILVALVLFVVQIIVVVSSDIISVYITRRILRKSICKIGALNDTDTNNSVSHSSVLVSILGLFVLDSILVLIIAGYPALLIFVSTTYDSSNVTILNGVAQSINDLKIYILGALIMNITTALPTIAYLLLSFIIMLHLLIWPSILRPFYNMLDSKIFERKRSLATVGVSLISVALFPESVNDVFSDVIDLLI